MSQHPVPRSRDLNPVPISRKAAKVWKGIDSSAEIEIHRASRQQQVAAAQIRSAVRVGEAAIQAQAAFSDQQQRLVELVPGSIHGISLISQRMSFGLARIVDQHIDDLTR